MKMKEKKRKEKKKEIIKKKNVYARDDEIIMCVFC